MTAKSRKSSTSDRMSPRSPATPSAATPADPASDGSRRPAPSNHGDGPAPDTAPSDTPIFDALCAELGDPLAGTSP